MNKKTRSSAEEVEQMYNEELAIDLEQQVPVMPTPRKKGKGARVFLTLVLIIIVVFVALLIISKVTNWNVLGLPKTPANFQEARASDWQAVFLSNGQVYFGRLKNVNSAYPTLEDVYYLQVQEVPIQPAPAEVEPGEDGVQPAQETQQQMILVKFGTEIHSPMDKMYINKDHVLMYENLSETSRVVTAINNYKADQANKIE